MRCGGILLWFESYQNEVLENRIKENEDTGVCLFFGAQGNVVGHNLIDRNTRVGVFLGDRDNTISSNEILSNHSIGIVLDGDDNTIQDNTIETHETGIRGISSGSKILNNTISSNTQDGIYLKVSSQNEIRENEITTSQGNGLYLFGISTENEIVKNEFMRNGTGLRFQYARQNDVIENTFQGNTDYGVYIHSGGTARNKLYHNNFIGNGLNATDYDSNQWDDGSEGNYWDNYTGVDADGNGIGDVPYQIPPGGMNQDRYPLMQPYTGP